jgi:predicted nucleic acid-binding protein
MLVDNEWPEDYPRKHKGRPRYEDLVVYSMHKGYAVSRSAIGRFGVRMRLLARMKNAGEVVRDVMKNLTAEKASETQKAVAEMITAETIDFIANKKSMSAKDITMIASAMRDCTQVAINADKYIRQQVRQKAEQAAKTIEALAIKKKISPETLKLIREQIYGIIK